MMTDRDFIKLGRRWLAKPPAGYEYRDTLLDAVGVVAASLFVDMRKVEIPDDSRGYEITRRFLEENLPTFFISADVAETLSNPDTIRNVRGIDLKQVYRGGLISFESASPLGKCHVFWNHSQIDMSDGITWLGCFPNSDLWFTTYLKCDGSILTNLLDEDWESNADTETHACGKQIITIMFNALLIMQSYPQYLTYQPDVTRQYIKGKNISPPKTFLLNRSPSRKLKRTVFDDGTIRTNEPHQGGTKRPHYRSGHWRRQRHSPRFEAMHPEVQVLKYFDGRTYHMKWIELAGIGMDDEVEQAEPEKE